MSRVGIIMGVLLFGACTGTEVPAEADVDTDADSDTDTDPDTAETGDLETGGDTGAHTGDTATTELDDCPAVLAADPAVSTGLFDLPTFGAGDASLVWCDFDTPGEVWSRRSDPLRATGAVFGTDVEIVIADPDVLVDEAGTWHIWYQGSRAPAFGDPADMIVAHGTSPDGLTWTVDATPALGAPSDPTAWDATHAETPSVVYDPDAPPGYAYKMYYSGAVDTHPLGFPQYGIGLAVSGDGVTFTRIDPSLSFYGEAGALLRVQEALADVPFLEGGVVADPEAFIDETGRYHLFFSSFGHDAGFTQQVFGITHLESDDGIVWEAGPNGFQIDPALGGQQPSVAFNPSTGLYEMVFTSDLDEERLDIPSTFNPSMGVLLATSPDLDTWTAPPVPAGRDFWWDGDHPREDLGLLTGAALHIQDGERWLFYTGWSTIDVPAGSFVTTQTGFSPGVLNLLLAKRTSVP